MGDSIAQTRSENVSKHSNDLLVVGVNTPRSGEDSMQLKELMDLCTNLQNRVLTLESTKTTQALEIDSLKRRAKKLKKKDIKRTHKLKRLYKGRIAGIDADEGITLDNTYFDTDPDMFGVHNLDGDEVFVETKEPAVHAAITTSTILVSAVKDLFNVDMTLAQALAKLKNTKPKAVTTAATTTTTAVTRPKAKGLVIQEHDKASTPITSSKDKGKGILDKVKTDYELAQRLQAKEQEELTIEEKSKLFQQLLEKRRKHFAAKRAEERRNIPPTKAQQRSIICTYLKNMAGWKPKDLKTKSFANVQELFDKAMKKVNIFVDMDTELVGGSKVRAEGSEIIAQESSLKRTGDKLEQENAKKQKVDAEKETEQETATLKKLVEIIPNKEEVAIDAISLATKHPSIVDWKIMLRDFDREDLETLWKLVKAKHGYTRLKEGYERVLYGDLKTMFEPNVEDMSTLCEVSKSAYLMLVEKSYPLTPATITDMLNRKL
ncbi:hypothetical protein Tco_0329157 [Tanacetum coccineum]